MTPTNREQMLPAFIAALLGEGCTPEQIERAVSAARSVRPGRSISELANTPMPQPLIRSFIWDQANRLESK